MKKLKTVVGASFGLALFHVTVAWASEQYLCEETAGGGVYYEEQPKRWKSAIFRPNGKYIVSKPLSDSFYSGKQFVVTKLGERDPAYTCSQPFSEHGFLICEGAGEFRMNSRTLRFQVYYFLGYVIGDVELDAPGNTPSVMIGVCSPF